MTVVYEWDVETVSAKETEDLAEGDVIEHYHCTTYAEACDIAAGQAPVDCRFEVVLVRDDDECRSWAYIDGGELPEYFEDASGSNHAKVPLRFIREVARAGRA